MEIGAAYISGGVSGMAGMQSGVYSTEQVSLEEIVHLCMFDSLFVCVC